MPNHKLVAVVGALIVFCLIAASDVKADPLSFSNLVALQNNGNTSVNLFSNPTATLFGPQLSFLVDINGTLPAGTSDTLSITYHEVGSAPVVQTFQIPAFGVIPPPYTQVFSFTSSGATFSGIGATLTIDILGTSPDFLIPSGPNAGQLVNSYTYSFNVAQPVPEPVSVLLLGTGLSGLVAAVFRRER